MSKNKYISGRNMNMDEALNKAKGLIFAGYESVNNESIYRLVLEDGSIYFPFVRKEYINYYTPNLVK